MPNDLVHRGIYMQSEKLADAPASIVVAKAPEKTARERLRLPLMVGFPILLAAVGATCYVVEEGHVSTDDAFVRSAKESVNARVSGQVVEIAVRNNQRVKKGQLLVRIDPEPYQIAIERAEAALGSARLQIGELKATYRQQLAELQSAKATTIFEEHEYDRKKALLASDFTSKSAYERADMDLKVARQSTASIEQQIAKTVAALNGDPDIEVSRHPTVRTAQANLDRAKLDYSYSVAYAPDDGTVANVDDLQVGDFVNPGATVFSLMSSRRIWIEANFRETEPDPHAARTKRRQSASMLIRIKSSRRISSA